MADWLEAKLFIGGCDVAILEVLCCMLWLNLFLKHAFKTHHMQLYNLILSRPMLVSL